MRITLRLAAIEDLLSHRVKIKKDYRLLKRNDMASESEKLEKCITAAESKPLAPEEIRQAEVFWNKGKVNLPKLPKFSKPRYFLVKLDEEV